MGQPQPTDQAQTDAEQIYTRETSDPRVCVVDGWGVKVTVERGQLVVSDGLAGTRRTREIPRIDRTVRRIIITGREGYVTLAALRWCKAHRLAIVTVDPYGALVALSATDDPADAPMIRSQALCGQDAPRAHTGLSIARMITGQKLAGQAENCWNVFYNSDAGDEIRRLSQFLDTAEDAKAINLLEAEAARVYWGAWSDVSMTWDRADIVKVPLHWHRYDGRINPVGRGNRYASHPVNAILNYAYRMLEIETRLACIAAGLEPSLGFLHSDREDRDSLVADVMEAARPKVDEYVLGMLAHPGNDFARRFRKAEFTELHRDKDAPDGAVRLVAPLTHEIAEQAVTWASRLYPVAEQVARMVAESATHHTVARAITQDKVIMAAPRPVAREVDACSADIISDKVWGLVESLAAQLPVPESSRSNVSHRDVIAALIYSRAARLPRGKVAQAFGLSENTVDRRFRVWRTMDAWKKLEQVVTEYAKRI
jgi:CRISPR-associated endonuclease Cas1